MVINVEINKTNPRNNFFQNGANYLALKKNSLAYFLPIGHSTNILLHIFICIFAFYLIMPCINQREIESD